MTIMLTAKIEEIARVAALAVLNKKRGYNQQ